MVTLLHNGGCEWIRRLVMTTSADFHHLDASLYVCVATVGIIDQVRHGYKLVLEGFTGGDSPLLVHGQHALQQVDKLTPINLLG